MRCGLLPPTRYDFYPRPPRGGRPCSCRRRVPPAGISIHALREEGDITVLIPNTYSKTFLSTPSARRATDDLIQIDFRDQISIHALREEGDRWKNQGSRGGFISIHALREEGDLQEQQDALRHQISIHALREEGDVGADEHIGNGDLISIHALREEGDHTSPWNGNPLRNFYPRPLRGGRLFGEALHHGGCSISIHALCEEGDGTNQAICQLGYQFLSTPSARRATAKR